MDPVIRPHDFESDDLDVENERGARAQARANALEIMGFEHRQWKASQEANVATGDTPEEGGAPEGESPDKKAEGGLAEQVTGEKPRRGYVADVGLGVADGVVDALRNTANFVLPEDMELDFDLPETET